MIFLKKFSLISICALVAASALSGCSGGSEKSTADISESLSTEEAYATEADIAVATETATEPATEIIRNIEPAQGTYVYDNAKLLSSDDFSECNDYAEWLYENFLINTAIVTTDNLDGMTPYEYAENCYDELYNSAGTGLLLLINNDTNKDYLYKTGSCLSWIDEQTENEVFYWATQEIIGGDYKSAILRLMKLGEACPQNVFDNGGIFTAEEISELESLCTSGSENISILATSNATGKTNEEICRTYYDRHYYDTKGFMVMLDTESDTIIVVSDNPLPTDMDSVLADANELATAGSYIEALTLAVNAIA
jgi:hypothetical protein